ncbi:MAG: response regulator transcription factor [Oscillospiraceae bacterium]|nr:response regulator transcription factor [Oscillospiraceae bacterium]
MEYKNKILIIEDERHICNFLGAVLTANNYEVLMAGTGEYGRAVINSHCPDLVILDLGLPDIDGKEVIESVRKWSSMPIIVVSARNTEIDKVAALELGADDYITKPFGTQELLARIRTALRHTRTASADDSISVGGVFQTGGLTIDYDKYRVYVDGRDVNLTQNEFKIVSLLGKNAGRVLTYDYIIKQLWGPHAKTDNQILRVNMANIRRKIEKKPAEPQYIFTEVGVGYRMAESEPVKQE